jgi:hypothetical protein
MQPVRNVRAMARGVNLPPCTLDPSGEELDFGSVPVGEVATSEVRLTNPGSLECMITGAAVVEVDAPFEVPPVDSLSIAPGSSASISVRFSPTGTITPSMATLEIGTSSPDEPYRRLALIGRGQ